jgi:GGDEF domain-containing protein
MANLFHTDKTAYIHDLTSEMALHTAAEARSLNVKHNLNCVGHLAGEEWLKDLGTFIKDNIRDVDLGAGYKEKQFAIVLGDTDRNGDGIVAEPL